MIQIRKFKPLKNESQITEVAVPKPEKNGFTKVGRLFIGKANNHWTVYDDTCDHNGGTLNLNRDGFHASCPRHKWKLQLVTGNYVNGCRKKTLEFEEGEEHLKVFKKSESFPEIKREHLVDEKMCFDFNAHASVSVGIGHLKIITDPWLLGSCFATGWWHRYPPTQAAIQRLQEADLIYISHNHPDHLHLPTLKKHVSSDAFFLIPNFKSKSVEKVLRREGYTNLIKADFLQEIEISKTIEPVKFVIVKSGDERDDSSLLMFTKTQSVFFGVDTNMPNRWILPKVDIGFTSFAGNASGFPHRVDNLSVHEKTSIARQNCQNSLANHVLKISKTCEAKFLVPYAGYFQVSDRDRDIKLQERTNSVEEAIQFIEQRLPEVKAINPVSFPSFEIERGQFRLGAQNKVPEPSLNRSIVESEIKEFSAGAPLLDYELLKNLGSFFTQSQFEGDLTILIIPTDNQFEPANEYYLECDFSEKHRGYSVKRIADFRVDEVEVAVALRGNHLEVLRIREDSLRGAIRNQLTLEELSIGFQIRMYRKPNVYNFSFWNYFSQQSLDLL